MKEVSEYFYGSFCEFRTEDINKRFKFATGKGVRIAVLDSGWDYSLHDNRIKQGIGLVNPDNELLLQFSSDFNDQNGHGTSCTELILRLAPDAAIYPVKVFGKEIETSINILIEGIKWAAEKDIKILNLSLSTSLSESLESIYIACEIARRKGMIIVASKPNKNNWGFPAIFENVIGVEQGEYNNIFCFEYNSGKAIECKAKGKHDDLQKAHGIRIASEGNSYAVPVITGLIALIIQNYPDYNIDDVRIALKELCLIK